MALKPENFGATLERPKLDLDEYGDDFAILIERDNTLEIGLHVDILTDSGQFCSREIWCDDAVNQLVRDSALVGSVIHFDGSHSYIDPLERYISEIGESYQEFPDKGKVVGLKWNLSADGGNIDFGSFSSLKSAEQALQVIATALRISGMAFKGQEAKAMHAQEAAPDRLRASLEVLNHRLDHSNETLATLLPKSMMRL